MSIEAELIQYNKSFGIEGGGRGSSPRLNKNQISTFLSNEVFIVREHYSKLMKAIPKPDIFCEQAPI